MLLLTENIAFCTFWIGSAYGMGKVLKEADLRTELKEGNYFFAEVRERA